MFNPENDIALGVGVERFTPGKGAELFRRAGQMLPYWLGDEGDRILVDAKDLDRFREWKGQMDQVVSELTGMHFCGPEPSIRVDGEEFAGFRPWGWSLAARRKLIDAGCDPQRLPSPTFLARHRELSGRKSSLNILNSIVSAGKRVPHPLPVVAKSMEDVEQQVKLFGKLYVKSPWSSSGRGVFPVQKETLAASRMRIEGVIRHQGYVMVEPALDKVADFACHYEVENAGVRFAGYSLFFNGNDTNYGGNLLVDDAAAMALLSRDVDPSKIVEARENVREALREILIPEGYSGPCGVDMMVFRPDSEIGRPDTEVAPCVELNLRYTMGHIARAIYRKLGWEGIMRITPQGARPDVAEMADGERLAFAPENSYYSFELRRSSRTTFST